jgi:hypothetical protein
MTTRGQSGERSRNLRLLLRAEEIAARTVNKDELRKVVDAPT